MMMGGLMMMVGGRVVMSGRLMMMLTGRMLWGLCHGVFLPTSP
jgi:predicted MFS family arabinose efflux permease